MPNLTFKTSLVFILKQHLKADEVHTNTQFKPVPSVPSTHIMCVFPSEEFLPMEKSKVCFSFSTQPRTCEAKKQNLFNFLADL